MAMTMLYRRINGTELLSLKIKSAIIQKVVLKNDNRADMDYLFLLEI